MASPTTDFKSVLTGIAGCRSSASLEPTNHLNGEYDSETEWVDRPELYGYQVALVSLKSDQAPSGRDASVRDKRDQLLILPWTWKDFVTHVRSEKQVTRPSEPQNIAQFGDVHVDFSSMEVRRSNRVLNLTALEFRVLKFFLMNPNRVISRQVLLDEVWGYSNYPCTRTVDNHILRLRRKLELEFANPVHFITVHRVGYKFVP